MKSTMLVHGSAGIADTSKLVFFVEP